MNSTAGHSFLGVLVRWCVLQDFHEEHAVQAFKMFDKTGSGFITAMDFKDIMLNIKSHLLTLPVQTNLVAVSAAAAASM